MKTKIFLALVLVLALLPPFVSTASAEQERVDFTFTEFCDPDTIQIEREIMNGQGNWLAKGFTQTCYDTGTIAEWTGTLSIDLNMNLTGNHEYVFFVGKSQLVSEEGGIWNLSCLYPIPSDNVQCVGKGEGLYEGKLIFIKVYPGYGGSGYIVNNGN